MKKIKNLFLMAVVLGLVSCSPRFYTPDTQNVPLISEKGETNLTLSHSLVDNHVEFQGAYGITNNIAIKTNGGIFRPSDRDNDGGSGRFIEIGGGYFKPITEKWIFETYGILGFGNVENHFPSTINNYPQTNGDISANIFRYGIQPNFGYKSKYFSTAISSRIVNMNYSNIKGNLIFEDVNQQTYLGDNSSNFLIEPALTLRAGFDKFKFQIQSGFSFNLSNSNFKQDHLFLTIGLNFNFKE